MMFTGFVLLELTSLQQGATTSSKRLEKLESNSMEMQVQQSSAAEMNKQIKDMLSEYARYRDKRSALSPTRSSSVAVDIGSLFVSAIKQICKPEGAVCIAGPKGDAGEDGSPGRDGLSGLTGQPGRDGQRGLLGLPGAKGTAGKQGPRGIIGMKGEVGQKGAVGEKGERGDKGDHGLSGVAGPQGDKGVEGDKGERGWIGYKGEKGVKGDLGSQGEKGMKGELGEKGRMADLQQGSGLPSLCHAQNHNVLNDTWRKQSVHVSKAGAHCDSHSHSFQPGWYAFSSEIGGAMPETCPPDDYCGTHAPGWLKGSHPHSIGQRVSRTVCFHHSSNCCVAQTTTEVINCGFYYVYNLPDVPYCYLAYCGKGN